MPIAPEQVISGVGTSGNTIVLTTTASIPVGRIVTVAFNRNPTSGTANGLASVTTSSGAFGALSRLADAVRVSASDTIIVALAVTTAIPSGATITVTTNATTANNRGAVLAVWPDLTSTTADATSGVTAQGNNGSVSYGPNGNSATATANTTASTTAGSRLILGAAAVGGTNTFTEAGGWTRIAEVRTSTGSSDRGVVFAYRFDNTPAVKTFSGTYSASTSWAAVVAALPGTFSVAAPSGWQYGSYAM